MRSHKGKFHTLLIGSVFLALMNPVEAQTPTPVPLPENLRASPSCGPSTTAVSRFALTGEELHAFLARRRTSSLLPAEDAPCFRLGQTVGLFEVRRSSSLKSPYFSGPPLLFRVAGIQNLNLLQFDGKAAQALGQPATLALALAAELAKARKMTRSTDKGLVMVRFEKTNLEFEISAATVPDEHAIGKTVSFAQAKAVKGAAWIDVRTLGEIRAAPLPGAVPAPFQPVGAKPSKVPLSPEEIQNKGHVIYPHLFPKNKAAPLIVFSRNALDFDGYNAVTLLAAEGFTNLHFLRGGFDETRALPSLPSLPLTHKVTYAHEISNLLRVKTPGVLLIDVRSKAEFNKGAIATAVHMSVPEGKDTFGHPLFRPAVLAPEVLKAKQEWPDIRGFVGQKAPKPPLPRLIFYGDDRADWRPFKAAVAAVAMGYQAAVFAAGWDEWRLRNEIFGNVYPLRKVKTKAPTTTATPVVKTAATPKPTKAAPKTNRPNAKERQQAAVERRARKLKEYYEKSGIKPPVPVQPSPSKSR